MAARDTRHKDVVRRRKEREKQQRMQSILDAATKVFLEKGFTKATMDDIALEAEITKPTIYQYFETKEHLYLSLMVPYIEELGKQVNEIEAKLLSDGYESGAALVHDLFEAMYRGFEISPESFRIVQFFQQSGQVWELSDAASSALSDKGRSNFERSRRVIELGIRKGLLRELSIYGLTDVIWGLFVGIVQLSDVKSYRTSRNPSASKANRKLVETLRLAEKVFTDAIALL
jgi:TetR/AcrR family transcriptional regulator